MMRIFRRRTNFHCKIPKLVAELEEHRLPCTNYSGRTDEAGLMELDRLLRKLPFPPVHCKEESNNAAARWDLSSHRRGCRLDTP